MKGSIPPAALVVITHGRPGGAGPGQAEAEETFGPLRHAVRPALRFLRRILPLTEDYDGRRLVTSAGKRRMFTPLVIVIAAIGVANVVFALDSIPAIFGLTSDAYIIFTANALALMGLRAAVLPDRRAIPQRTGRHPRIHRVKPSSRRCTTPTSTSSARSTCPRSES